MADSINGITGGKNYFLGGLVPQRKQEVPEEPKEALVRPDTKDIDWNEVMKVLSANAYMPVNTGVKAVVAPDVAERAVAAMADFERFMSIATEEVGDESLALLLADAYSEK